MNKILFINKTLLSLLLTFSFLTMTYAAPAPIITSTQDKGARADNSFGIGYTISSTERPFIGVGSQVVSQLYLSYKYKDFYIEGLDVGYNLFKNNKYHVDFLLTPRYYEVEPAFAKGGELNGIDITKQTYFAGFSSQFQASSLTYTMQLLFDANESKGFEALVQMSKSYKVGDKVTLIPSAGLTFQDAKLVDHFYAVQSHEVASGRPFYAGKSTLNYNATFNAVWNVTKHLEMLGQFKYEVLGKGISDSPIINENTHSLTLGFVYRF